MKIQPVDCSQEYHQISKPVPVLKSKLKRLFDRQFQSVLKITDNSNRDGDSDPLEPSSVCLAKMVQNFIEESNEKHPTSARNCCNCFKGSNNDISDDEFDASGDHLSNSTPPEPIDFLKSLIPCASVTERNVLADTSRIVDRNKLYKRKDEEMRRIVTDGLTSLGYDASICESHWDKSPYHPAGEYEFIDVIAEEGRLIIDIDFRSEFQIARPTGGYKSALQSLPLIFVGKSDRLKQIVSIMSEAARQSLRKKGMPFPPWRKAEYMRSKWLAPHARASAPEMKLNGEVDGEMKEKVEEVVAVVPAAWTPPAVKVKCVDKEVKAVTGLASLLKGKA